MTYWIYSMGLPVPVRDDRLRIKKEVEPLSAFARMKKLSDEKKNIYQELTDNSAPSDKHVNVINLTYQDNTKDKRRLVLFAEEIMSHPVASLSEKTLYDEAWNKFQLHKFHHFPILSEYKWLIGIVSDRDMLAHAVLHKTGNQAKNPIKALMNNWIVTASPKTNIREICQVMLSQYLGAMPITNDLGDLLGIITRSDILKTIVKNEPIEFWV
ncbi:HPP family protein [Colwellia sp. MB02u-14]|uniref:CBS domain-containing protein n=1 Tax=Colwellia sp. MB02u-14 TaxID=2759815 RepID=UPI0015F41B5A|nr:CBS domain-containing protein [Colwellia sp. MB02u-14]MBA6304427.1 CBS domain-containing protein [Colwellia sp. MB02u-14]